MQAPNHSFTDHICDTIGTMTNSFLYLKGTIWMDLPTDTNKMKDYTTIKIGIQYSEFLAAKSSYNMKRKTDIYHMLLHTAEFKPIPSETSQLSSLSLPYCIIYLVSKQSLNLQFHLCDPASISIANASLLKTGTDTLKWNQAAHLCCKKLLKKHWCVQWSGFREHATLHFALRLPLFQSSAFQPSSFNPPLVSNLWPSVTATKLSRKTDITVKL